MFDLAGFGWGFEGMASGDCGGRTSTDSVRDHLEGNTDSPRSAGSEGLDLEKVCVACHCAREVRGVRLDESG